MASEPPVYFSAGECQCPTCGDLFSSTPAFDAHLAPLHTIPACRPPAGIAWGEKSARAGEPRFRRLTRRNPDGTARHVWALQPHGEFPAALLRSFP